MNSAFAVSVDATVPDFNYKITSSKERIKKLQKWTRYIVQLNQIDKFISKQTDLDLLGKIKLKLEVKKDLVFWKDELTFELLNYISLIVDKRIDALEIIESADILKQVEKNTLTSEEIKKVEDEIVKLQLNLLDSSKTFVDKIMSDLKKSLSVEKTWNLKLNIEGSGAMIGSWKWELSIKNIKSRNANFDSELEAQVDLLTEASMVWWVKLKSQFSSFINFISKDGNMYLLLQKLNYSWLDSIDYSWEFTSILDKLKEMWDKNQYVKIEDKQSALVLNMIKNFDINSIYSESNKVLSEPMFKPYKKEWDKYLLIPTKKACDTMKYISYKMNSYWSYTCSDEEYNDMLKSIVSGWKLYIIVDWSDKHFWFDLTQYWVVWYIKIYSSDKKIEKILAKIEEIAWKYKWNIAELIYLNWQKLDFIFDAKSENTFLSFKSLLTSDNKFSKIEHVWNFSKWTDWFKSSFKLENKIFNGNIELIDSNDFKLSWNISWELNSSDDLSAFNFVVKSTDNKEKYNYDFETWKSSYTPTKVTFDLNYALKNEIITWTISYKENSKELFKVISNWKYKKEYFELNNSVNITDWEEWVKEEKVNWNLNTKFVWNLEKNNFDLFIDFTAKEWYIKINLTSDSKVEYKDDIKINAPTNYKKIEDLTWNQNLEGQDSPENIAPEFFE